MQDDAMTVDGYDDCIVGIVERCGAPDLVCYDVEQIMVKLCGEGLSRDEAREHYYFNILGAWVGPGTPCFLATDREVLPVD